MTDDVLETIEETRFSRRGLLVKGGLTAAGLTALGSPTCALGANRRARPTRSGSRCHPRRHRLVLVGVQEGRRPGHEAT